MKTSQTDSTTPLCGGRSQSLARMPSIVLAALVAAGAVSSSAWAQSTFSIPNPLIKPASRGEAPGQALAARSPGSASPVAPGAGDVGATPGAAPRDSGGAQAGGASAGAPGSGGAVRGSRPPMPPAVGDDIPPPVVRSLDSATGAPVLPGAASARAGSEGGGLSAAIDHLSSYTVTALVGDMAILRTNVGALAAATAGAALGGMGAPGQNPSVSAAGSPATPGGFGGAAPGVAGAGMAVGAVPKSRVIRIRHQVPLTVMGVRLIPFVTISGVDFAAEDRHGVLVSVSMESMAPPLYGVLPQNRETADPNMGHRITPAAGPRGGGASQATSGVGAATPGVPGPAAGIAR